MFIIILISAVKLFSWLGMVPVLLMQNVESSRVTFTVLIALFVLADVLDGNAWAKIFGKRGARTRRLVDNVSDVLASHSVCLTLLYQLRWSMLWYAPLFIRDGFLTWMAAVSLFKGRVVVFPGYAHKAAKGGLAVAAVAMAWGWHGEVILTLAYVFFFISFLDYLGAFRVYRANSHHVREGIREVYMFNTFACMGYAFADTQKLLSAPVPQKLIAAGAEDLAAKKAHDAVKKYALCTLIDYVRFMEPWLTGWALPSLPTENEYEHMLKQAGFVQVMVRDFTQQVRPSLERLGEMCQRVLRIRPIKHIRGSRRFANLVGSLRMYEALEKELWRYMVITAQKP